MKKVIFVFILILLIPIIAIFIFKIINDNAPFKEKDISSLNSYDKEYLKGKSEIGLLHNLLFFAGSEGRFYGNINVAYSNKDNSMVVTIRDNYVPDDSLGPFEQRFVAKKYGDEYKVIKYSERYSCSRGGVYFKLFQMLFYPIWTEKACP